MTNEGMILQRREQMTAQRNRSNIPLNSQLRMILLLSRSTPDILSCFFSQLFKRLMIQILTQHTNAYLLFNFHMSIYVISIDGLVVQIESFG